MTGPNVIGYLCLALGAAIVVLVATPIIEGAW